MKFFKVGALKMCFSHTLSQEIIHGHDAQRREKDERKKKRERQRRRKTGRKEGRTKAGQKALYPGTEDRSNGSQTFQQKISFTDFNQACSVEVEHNFHSIVFYVCVLEKTTCQLLNARLGNSEPKTQILPCKMMQIIAYVVEQL